MKKLLPKIALFNLLLLTFAQVALAGFSMTPSTPGDRQFTLEIAAGKEKQSSVIIRNVSDKPISLNLYGADGTQSNQGTFALTTLSTPQKHIGKWVVFSKPTVDLASGEQKEIGFTVKVPEQTTPGVYSGGIAAESGTNITNSSAATNGSLPAQGNSISISSRIVVKIFVTVPGQKIHKYEWTGFSYEKTTDGGSSGTFILNYKNTGNTVVSIGQKIQISGFPMQVGTIEPTPATLLQGGEIKIPVKWDKEPFFGFYTAKAEITFGEYDVIKNAIVNPQTENREISIYIPLKTDTYAGKIVLVVLSILCVLILFLAFIVIRHVMLKKRCRPYIVKEGDTISSIAENCKINWKKLAKLNKLRAPYSIKMGQRIMAPKNDPQKK